MIELHKIPITVRIEYTASEYSANGWALARAVFNGTTVANFEANNNTLEFNIVPTNEFSCSLKIEHYGKNYITDNKFIEITKMYINNIDLEHVLWQGVQVATLPPWDDGDPVMPGNLYLGHNGYIEWTFENPLLKDLQSRLNKGVQQIVGQETTYEILEQMKSKFF